jgi:recombination protein RecR
LAYPNPLETLIAAFEGFPGVGRVTAERLAFHILREPRARLLAPAIVSAAEQTCRCSECGNITELDPCPICRDPARDSQQIAVVSEPRHVEAMERAQVFRGRYHVLMGSFNPAEGTEIEHLEIAALIERVKAGATLEVILATDPDAEGEATALFVVQALESACDPTPLITRLARGLPAGSALEYLHRGILEDALEGRRPIHSRRPVQGRVAED